LSNSWYFDSTGEIKDNGVYAKRLHFLSNCKILELYGIIHADVFSSNIVLINGVDINIKLTRAPESSYLLASSDDNILRFKILDALLFITQVELKPLFFLLKLMFWE